MGNGGWPGLGGRLREGVGREGGACGWEGGEEGELAERVELAGGKEGRNQTGGTEVRCGWLSLHGCFIMEGGGGGRIPFN